MPSQPVSNVIKGKKSFPSYFIWLE